MSWNFGLRVHGLGSGITLNASAVIAPEVANCGLGSVEVVLGHRVHAKTLVGDGPLAVRV